MHLAFFRQGGVAMFLRCTTLPASPLATLLHRPEMQRQYRSSPVVFASADGSRIGKADLVKLIKGTVTLTAADTTAVVDAMLDVIVQQVAEGKKVTITGFGTFEKRVRAARDGRNPSTGAAIKIPETQYPAFSAGKSFKDRVKESK